MAAPAPKVSVVVPVYNPGAALEECAGSLLAQTMRPGDLELIFVDDGSTDGSGERLDALAAAHPHVRVRHIPNSGWPGRPRNVGLGMARGDYVFFADNDDRVDPEGLERVHAAALADDADVVLGKVVGHGGKRVPPAVFERNLHGVKLRSAPVLLRMLTPHKLFRRALLEEHGLRFPEGVRRLEDHPFVVDAYLRARRISVVADHPVYHWITRDPARSASRQRIDPRSYYGNVREVLDLVERRTEPGPVRDRLMLHWLRGKMLGRVGGRAFLKRPPDLRRGVFEAVRELALERYPEAMDAGLAFNLRVRARLLRDGSMEGLERLAAYESTLRSRVRLKRVKGNGKHLFVRVDARLEGRRGTRFAFRREGDRVLWVPPEPLRDALPEAVLDVTEDLAAATVQVQIRSVADGAEYIVPGRTQVRLVEAAEPGTVRPVLSATAWLTPTTAAGGGPLPAGEWEVRALVDVAGFSHRRRVERRGRDLVVTSVPPGRIVAGRYTPPPPPSRRTRVLRRIPRPVRRTLGAAAAAVRG